MQNLRVNNSRILKLKNEKFARYLFYKSTKIKEQFQICISVPLSKKHGIIYINFLTNSQALKSMAPLKQRVIIPTTFELLTDSRYVAVSHLLFEINVFYKLKSKPGN